MTLETEARAGMGGATEYQVRDTESLIFPMIESQDHDIDIEHLANLLTEQGE